MAAEKAIPKGYHSAARTVGLKECLMVAYLATTMALKKVLE